MNLANLRGRRALGSSKLILRKTEPTNSRLLERKIFMAKRTVKKSNERIVAILRSHTSAAYSKTGRHFVLIK